MASNDNRDAIEDIIFGLKKTFKNYNRSTRRQAWEAVLSAKGRKQVDKLINNPDQPITGLPKLRFKEWFDQNFDIQS